MSTGWICPRCNTVMAPHILVCLNCSGNQSLNIESKSKIPDPRCVPSPYFEKCPHGLLYGCSICGSLKK